LALDGCEQSASHSNCCILVVKAPGTCCIGEWVSLRALLVDVEKRKISAYISDQTLVPQQSHTA